MKPYGWKPRANAYVGRPEQLERVVSKRLARREHGLDTRERAEEAVLVAPEVRDESITDPQLVPRTE